MAITGSIIEYLESGKFSCGVVTGVDGKRVHVINQNGREVNLPLTRIIHESSRPLPAMDKSEILKHMQSLSHKRHSLMASINLEEIWNLISEEPEELYEPRLLAELFFGNDTNDDHIASFLRAIFQDRLFFKFKEGKVIAHPPEVTEQLRQQMEKEKQQEELLSTGAEGLSLIYQDVDQPEWAGREKCLQLIKEYYLFDKEAKNSALARQLLKKAKLTGPHDPFHLLVKAGVWKKNENIPLLRSELSKEFSDGARLQAESLKETDPDTLIALGREDLRHLPLMTIDGKYTRDFDDALHIEKQGENYLVGVHISDVTHYISPGTPLFEEALTRCTSIYFPDTTIPMMPQAISEGLCSLIAGKERPALSFMILMSTEGEILDYRITASVVTVKRQLNYAEVNNMISSDEELTILSNLSQKLRKKRLASGALILPFPELEIYINPDDTVNIKLSDTESDSRVLVSEFMILANTLAAGHMADRETPALFRSQPPPRKRLVEGFDRDLYINIRQRKMLSPMTLSVKAKPHSSLGVQLYTTITSPIRRLVDLLMQHQLINLLRNNSTLFTKRDLRGYADIINTTQSRVNTSKQLRQRYWILKHLESLVGERVDAMIIERGHRRVHVVLVNYMLDADLPANQGTLARPGETVPVRIAKANALSNILRVEW